MFEAALRNPAPRHPAYVVSRVGEARSGRRSVAAVHRPDLERGLGRMIEVLQLPRRRVRTPEYRHSAPLQRVSRATHAVITAASLPAQPRQRPAVQRPCWAHLGHRSRKSGRDRRPAAGGVVAPRGPRPYMATSPPFAGGLRRARLYDAAQAPCAWRGTRSVEAASRIISAALL